jgi:hypothetical protein
MESFAGLNFAPNAKFVLIAAAFTSKLKKAYQSKEVKEFIEKKFDGSVLPSW